MIDDCNNKVLLEEARLLLTDSNWNEELSKEDKNKLAESEEQYARGEFIPHDELLQRMSDGKRTSLDAECRK